MVFTVLGKHNFTYINQVRAWAKRLGATEMVIHTNGSVTLDCKDDNICREYKPTPQELKNEGKGDELSWKEEASFYGEY